MKATLIRTHVEDIAKNIMTFWFEPEKALDQQPGQYIEMTLKHEDPDERGQKRWFTLSNSPTDAPLISITTKFAANNSSSFKQALRALKPGDQVLISDPMGDFVLPKDHTIPLVFIAGGIGITPFHSIIKWLYDTRQERDITFVYSVNIEHEIVFQDLFEHYGLDRTIIVNKPEGSWDGESGKLTVERILAIAEPADDALIFTSGPESLVEGFEKDFKAAGIPAARLVSDFFPGYTAV